MPVLTAGEKKLFTAGQLAQLARLSASRRDEYLDALPGADAKEFRASVLAKLARRSVAELRARVNVIGVSWGKPIVVNYAPENDYTAAEMQTVTDVLDGGKWLFRIPEILAAGLSVKQRLTAGGL